MCATDQRTEPGVVVRVLIQTSIGVERRQACRQDIQELRRAILLRRRKRTKRAEGCRIERVTRSENSDRNNCLKLLPESDPRGRSAKVERMVALRPAQVIGKFAHWAVAPLWTSRNSCVLDGPEIREALAHSLTIRCLIRELSGIDFREEQSRTANDAVTRFVNDVVRNSPTPTCRVRKTNRRLRAVIRESRKRGVNVIQEVHHATEVLVIPDILEVVFLRQVKVETDCRELALLAALVDEGCRLQVRIAGVLDRGARQGTADTSEQRTDSRIDG